MSFDKWVNSETGAKSAVDSKSHLAMESSKFDIAQVADSSFDWHRKVANYFD